MGRTASYFIRDRGGDDLLLQRTAPGHRLDRTSLIFTPVIKYKVFCIGGTGFPACAQEAVIHGPLARP